MASRLMANRVYTGKKDWKLPNFVATIGSTGAATIVTSKSFGVVTVTRGASAGLYLITFGVDAGGQVRKDPYKYFLGAHFFFKGQGGPPAISTVASVCATADATATAGTCTLQVQCLDFAGSAVDPASGEVMYGIFFFADSGAP